MWWDTNKGRKGTVRCVEVNLGFSYMYSLFTTWYLQSLLIDQWTADIVQIELFLVT